jgi:hypothetical protein
MPLPNRRTVFDPRWNDRHRPVAAATLTDDCIITRGGGPGTVDPNGNWTPTAGTTVYTGKCRIQAAGMADRVAVVGEEQITTGLYHAAVPHDAPQIQVGDVITVTAAEDPRLTGRHLSVLDHLYGSQQWQRDLLCQDNLG